MLLCPAAAPVPCPNLYVQLNALQLVLDPRSLVWLNLFALDLRQSLEQFMEIYKLNDSQKPDEHVDIKVDGLMLKVSLEAVKVNGGYRQLHEDTASFCVSCPSPACDSH